MLITNIQIVTLPNYLLNLLIAKRYMDINIKNELYTRQGMNSRQIRKGQLSIERSLYPEYNIVTNDEITINVYKVYMFLRSVSMQFQIPCAFLSS